MSISDPTLSFFLSATDCIHFLSKTFYGTGHARSGNCYTQEKSCLGFQQNAPKESFENKLYSDDYVGEENI